MRHIDHQKVPNSIKPYGGNDICALYEPGAGGAYREYEVYDSSIGVHKGSQGRLALLRFQEGAIQEVGVNGVQQEDLLSIVIDRLQAFQNGPFANDYNQKALDHTRWALEALKDRTRDRAARGVEGFLKA